MIVKAVIWVTYGLGLVGVILPFLISGGTEMVLIGIALIIGHIVWIAKIVERNLQDENG